MAMITKIKEALPAATDNDEFLAFNHQQNIAPNGVAMV